MQFFQYLIAPINISLCKLLSLNFFLIKSYSFFDTRLTQIYRMAYIIFIAVFLYTKAVIRQYFETYCILRKPSYCSYICMYIIHFFFTVVIFDVNSEFKIYHHSLIRMYLICLCYLTKLISKNEIMTINVSKSITFYPRILLSSPGHAVENVFIPLNQITTTY